MRTKSLKAIEHEDLLVRIFTGKYSEYKYKSPRYGYKWAHRHNKAVYLYIAGHFDDGYFDTLYFKSCTNEYILNYITTYKETSRLYKRAKALYPS